MASGITYKDDFGRIWDGPFPFNISTIRFHAPRQFGIYEVLKHEAGAFQIMYIGIATGATIFERLTKHCSGLGNKHIAGIGNPINFFFVYWLCDPQSARQIESHVITRYKPPFNIKPEYKHFIESIYIH
jgi:excinuclease UvrABC nuclease subunit